MSDAQLMLNTMQALPRHGSPLFRDSQQMSLADIPNGNYSNGQTTFQLQTIENDMFCLAGMELQIPFSVSVNGVLSAVNCLGQGVSPALTAGQVAAIPATFAAGIPNNGAPTIPGVALASASQCSFAFKSSSLDMVSGLNVGLGASNSSIVSDVNYLPIMSQIRLTVQNSDDWLRVFGSKLCFAPDTRKSITVGEQNTGFCQRQASLYSQSTCDWFPLPGAAANSTVVYCSRLQGVATIPLHLLHPFLSSSDYLDRGVNYRLNFLFGREFNQQALTSCFVFAGAVPTTKPTYAIGGQVSAGGASWSSCMLRYRSVSLPPEVQVKFDSALLAGKADDRVVRYSCSDYYDSVQNSALSLSSYQLSNGIVRPLRMWCLGFTPQALASQTLLRTTSVVWSSLNARIGTTRRYINDLVDGPGLYEELRDQFEEMATSPDKQSLLDYQSFYPTPGTIVSPNGEAFPPQSGQAHYAVVDLSRTQNRANDSALTLQVNAIRTGNTPADFLVIVEREQVATISRARNAVTVQVGST